MSESASTVLAPPPHHTPSYTTLDYKKLSKALQLVSDRTKPLFVPILCKLWDSVDGATFAKLMAAICADGEEAAQQTAGSVLQNATFPVPPEVKDFIQAAIKFRYSIK
jgi:hypothetical protein